jgi:hypothetical protein
MRKLPQGRQLPPSISSQLLQKLGNYPHAGRPEIPLPLVDLDDETAADAAACRLAPGRFARLETPHSTNVVWLRNRFPARLGSSGPACRCHTAKQLAKAIFDQLSHN